MESTPDFGTHLGPEEVAVLLGAVPERIGDLVAGLDEPRLRYRHAPALPTIKEVVAHLCEVGAAADAMLRHAYLENQVEIAVRSAIDPARDPDLSRPLADMLGGFARVRRRTVDMLRGMSDADWDRPIRDPQQGELTLLDVCAQLTSHEVAHLSQLRNLTSQLPEG